MPVSSPMHCRRSLPALFPWAIRTIGWPNSTRAFAAFKVLTVTPIAQLMLRSPPEQSDANRTARSLPCHGSRLGLPFHVALTMLEIASFCCCVPLAMPQGHLAAFCGDLVIAAEQEGAMSSLLPVCAFRSRQFWAGCLSPSLWL